MSPRPSSFSAPPESRMTRLSTCEPTANAIREGMLALIRPVMMSAEGRCVAVVRWVAPATASRGDTPDELLDLAGRDHHQVGQLVDDDHDVGQLPRELLCRLVVVGGDVAHVLGREHL